MILKQKQIHVVEDCTFFTISYEKISLIYLEVSAYYGGIYPPPCFRFKFDFDFILIRFIYFFHFKTIFAILHIRQIQIHFATQRFQFHFDFSRWHISAILCLFCCSMAYIRQWGTPLEYRDFGMLATKWYIYNVRVHSFCSKKIQVSRAQA